MAARRDQGLLDLIIILIAVATIVVLNFANNRRLNRRALHGDSCQAFGPDEMRGRLEHQSAMETNISRPPRDRPAGGPRG